MGDGLFDDAAPTGHGQPSPEARERILKRCRREMAARFQAERRLVRRRHWGLAISLALLLALNAVEEQRTTTRLARLTQAGPGRSPATAEIAGSVRARARLLTSLLRDPNTL